ncbi:MAG: NfeD family protein, partial [Cutibacterium avidum]|nr:NfeD family protein [Cutibacterium avidum]
MMEPFEDWPWLVWLVGSAVLACTEMLTGDFTLPMLAGGAVAGAFTAFFLPGMILV